MQPVPLDKGSDKPVGEPVTEFAKGADKGPFSCGNCVHMRKAQCFHPVMLEHSKQPKGKQGGVKVGEYDCCRFVRRGK